MSDVTSPPCYRPLLAGNIRLLRLLPHEDENAPIQCELFEYSLQGSGKRGHLYDALSYVWGDPQYPRSISIDGHNMFMTKNLHAALLHLRNFSLERIIWIDAICINQNNNEEKAEQIQLMAQIYGQANRVIVWLGEAADNSDQALEELRAAGSKATHSLENKTIQVATLSLLRRNWFKRIWILQEVATARRILIMCGHTEIDGYIFCWGIDSLKEEFFKTQGELQSLIRSVTFLIRGATFRLNHTTSGTMEASKGICTLGELIDMYQHHNATLLHDKVYALLGMSGMSPNDLSKAGLVPNYNARWDEIFQQLVRFLLGRDISVNTWSSMQIASIKSKGCVLGKVTSVQNISLNGRQSVGVILKGASEQLWSENKEKHHTRWTLQPTAKLIQVGDFICFLQGASKPTIIRLNKDHFVIIAIAATPLETEKMESRYLKKPKLFARNLVLVWDWRNSEELQDSKIRDGLDQKHDWILGYWKRDIGCCFDTAVRICGVVAILIDLEEHRQLKTIIRDAKANYEITFEEKLSSTPEDIHGWMPLLWIADNGYEETIKRLVETDEVEVNLKDANGRTPLLLATKSGRDNVVKLLLETGKAEVNSKDRDNRTSLYYAVKNKDKAIVILLLKTSKIDVNSKDDFDQTPLYYAVENGDEAIVKLLLETDEIEVNSKDCYNETPLSCAVRSSNEAIIKLLLETGKVMVNSKDDNNQTPLFRAVESSNKTIIKLLLETGKVEVNSKDRNDRTPLHYAVENRDEAIVKLLLETGKVEVNSKDRNYRTLLSYAVEKMDEAIVRLLLETGKVEVNSKDYNNQTPLYYAIRGRSRAIVKLLLETGKVEVNSKDRNNRTLVFYAVENKDEAIVKLLLDTGKVEVDSKDCFGRTPLFYAARDGNEAIVKLLLASNAKVKFKDDGGTSIVKTAKYRGHKAVVKLLRDHVAADSRPWRFW